MLPYIVVFSFTILFTQCAQTAINKNRKILCFFCSAMAILLPSILAGLRGESVGTDVLVYVKPVYNIANRYDSFFEFFSDMKGTGYSCTEFGYLVITYLSNSLQMLLFSIQFITMYYVYKALFSLRKQLPMWLGMLVYLIVCYCTSLNLMRQCVSIAIILYASTQLIQKKFIRFSIYVIFASLFHSSAIAMFGLLLLWFVAGSDVKRWKIWAMSAVLCFVMISWDSISSLLITTNLLPSYYYKYITGNISLNFDALLLQFPFLAIELLSNKNASKKRLGFSYYHKITTMAFLLIPISTLWTYSYRILYYFYVYRVFTVPIALTSIQNKRNKKYLLGCMLVYLIIYWLWSTRDSSALPYVVFWN